MTPMDNKSCYITTPIYYVNGQPHIGAALTTVACDVLARYQRLMGKEALLLTGTDENATKVQEAAEKAGRPIAPFVQELAEAFRTCWTNLDVDMGDFIRTTEPRHVHAVQVFFGRLLEKGYVYKDVYEGWYSVSDETFFRDTDVEDGIAKETGKPVVRLREENYFFRLSAFSDRLLAHINANPDFLLPEFRRNEAVKFIEEGLRDMCITRPNRGWGIPFPGDDSKIIYVWFDALVSYLAATGWPDSPDWEKLWPADLHFMGKEIFVRFHATLWPAMLMALDIPLPKQVFAHGFWTLPGLKPGEKAGKSTGGLPHPVSFAKFLAERAGTDYEVAADALRYLLCREMNFGMDTEFTVENFLRRFNTDLANDLGNLFNRTLNMVQRYLGGVSPTAPLDEEIGKLAADVLQEYHSALADFRINLAIEAMERLVARMNKYVDEQAPWALAKAAAAGDAASEAKLQSVLATCLEAMRLSALMVSPIMPIAAERLLAQTGRTVQLKDIAPQEFAWGGAKPVERVAQPQPLFPRLQSLTIDDAETAAIMAPPGTAPQRNEEKIMSEITQPAPGTPAEPESKTETSLIGIEDFMKVELLSGEVLAAEPVANATKLLRLTVQVGEEEARTILAGIAEYYTAEELVGKQVVVVANLQPRKMRGIESQGMLLAADVEGRAILLQPDKPVPPGSRVR